MASLETCLEAEKQLEELLVELRESDTAEVWGSVQQNAQKLADALRTRDTPEDNHTVLGRTGLPQTLTLFISLGLHGAGTPSAEYIAPIYEILRLGANLCMNHDENRGHLLEAGFPQAMVSLLEGYAEKIASSSYAEPLSLSVSQLKLVRTAIGVLLNASIGYDPVRFRLISLEASVTIIKLSTAIYPPGSWTACEHQSADSSSSCEEMWTLRSGIIEWAWRTISELREGDEGPAAFSPDVLPSLIPCLQAFIPGPDTTTTHPKALCTSHLDLLDSDLECLEETCMLLESLSLDIEDVRLSLARGFNFPAEHGGVPCLSIMLDFIEKGIYPSLWYHPQVAWEAADLKRKERAFDVCKAAIIKTIVEVAGEEHNDDVLWDDSDLDQPGGPFVCMMVDWIMKYVRAKDENSPSNFLDRDDLAICASLSLGNLARREKHATTLLQPPLRLAPILTSKHLLSANTDIKLRHAVIGLLKNVAQSASQSPVIHVELGNASIIDAIVGSGVWGQQHDAMVEVVQVGAIGVVKHLCNASEDNANALVLHHGKGKEASSSGLDQLLALIERSDSIAVKSEGTRVLVNVIKSLWSGAANASSDGSGSGNGKRQEAMETLFTTECTTALANLVTRSGKFPLLVNEGVVALSLLSTHPTGAPLVLSSLMVTLPPEVPATSPLLSSTSPVVSVTTDDAEVDKSQGPTNVARHSTPRHALDMIKSVLRNVDNPANFPVEVRMNVCSLLLQIGRNVSGQDCETLKELVSPLLKTLSEKLGNAQGKEEMLAKSVTKVLDSWTQ